MRPEHIQELMRNLNQPKLAQENPSESENGDDEGRRDEGSVRV
jgi:hypothetical protein